MQKANKAAQLESDYTVDEHSTVDVLCNAIADWTADLLNYLKGPARGASKRIRYKALRYVLIGDELYFRTLEGLLLKCLSPTKALEVMHDEHEGACGTH